MFSTNELLLSFEIHGYQVIFHDPLVRPSRGSYLTFMISTDTQTRILKGDKSDTKLRVTYEIIHTQCSSGRFSREGEGS